MQGLTLEVDIMTGRIHQTSETFKGQTLGLDFGAQSQEIHM